MRAKAPKSIIVRLSKSVVDKIRKRAKIEGRTIMKEAELTIEAGLVARKIQR